MAEPGDIIDVRPDEGFDVASLAEHLHTRIPGATGLPEVRQFGGGHANLTYLLRYPEVDYVLRRPPLGPVAEGSHDMGREHRVLAELWRSFPPAPRSYLFCDDRSVIGVPFFVMERKDGIVVRKVVPDRFGGGRDEKINRQLSEAVIDTLADFHAVDPHEAGLAKLGHPDGFMQRQVDGWARRWHLAKDQDVQIADALIEWLQLRRPASPPPTLVHNDWRLDNMAVDPEDPSTCVAVYDWDMCTQGDPLADLGTLLSVWYDSGEIPADLNPMPTGVPGFMTRAEAIARYTHRTGIRPETVDYYLVFGSFKMAVIVQQIYIRWKRGQTKDDRFAVMGEAARHLLTLAEQRRP